MGVNVYTVEPIEVVLITAGDQVPVMGGKLFDIVGNTPGEAFKQYGPICEKVGIMLLDTTTVIVVVVPHCPAVGVNVYTVEPIADVFMTAGTQVPVIGGELFDNVGNTPGIALKQYGPNCVKVGVMLFDTTTVIVVVVPH